MNCPSCGTQVDSLQRFCPNCGTVLAPSDVQAADPMLGQTLGGKYKINRLLGEGGMGAVYEGEQELGTTKRKVAVKTLHPQLSSDPKIQARFKREVGTLAGLQHPNTIQVFDFGSTQDEILYIVMEFLSGKSLADTLEKEGPMMPERSANIIRQVCGSLEEAHASDIVHRDLKPDNIVLIERAGQKDFVKVLDFGIAKRSKEEDKQEQKLTQQGMVLGTPPYMSPEQFSGRPIDRRSDIYSLAVMAYEMLTGKLPFRANTAWEWATQHMTQPPIPIETVAEGMRAPEPMRAAIGKALAKSPDERFQTVKEFGDAFAGAIGATRGSVSTEAAVPPRLRTEVAPPLEMAAAFGSSPAFNRVVMTPTAPIGPLVTQGDTPVGGNVAFPTPAGIPQASALQPENGGSRTPLIIVASVVGVASIVAIAFALKGPNSQKSVQFTRADSVPGADPSVVLSSVPVVPTDVVPASTGGLPPLASVTGGGPVMRTVPRPTTAASIATLPTSTPTPASTPARAPATYDGPECQLARAWRAMGRTRAAEHEAQVCIAKGGSPL